MMDPEITPTNTFNIRCSLGFLHYFTLNNVENPLPKSTTKQQPLEYLPSPHPPFSKKYALSHTGKAPAPRYCNRGTCLPHPLTPTIVPGLEQTPDPSWANIFSPQEFRCKMQRCWSDFAVA